MVEEFLFGFFIHEDICEAETEKPVVTSEKKAEDVDKVVFVDFVTYLSKRKKKVEKVAVKAVKIEEVIKEKQADIVQLSLFG